MKYALKYFFICILILSANFYGCLKDKIAVPVQAPLVEGGKLLYYLEEEGDYINSSAMPSLVNVDEVYSNLQSYLLLDIRPSEEFSSGHIEGAINKSPSQLIALLDSLDFQHYPKIVIISRNGQSSAYYTCLLRLYGFNNTYSMSYGMAAWNQAFSDQWLNARDIDYSLLGGYSQDIVPKPPFTPLPKVNLSGSSLEESVKQRIKDLLQITFEDSLINHEGEATINYGWLMSNNEDYFIVCFDTLRLYKNITDGIFHPAGAVLFHPFPRSELSSSEYLQSFPSNKKSALYSVDGQQSAFIVAYLRLLGYDAKSVLFGANNMFYPLLLNSLLFHDKAFSEENIRNYPFVTGN